MSLRLDDHHVDRPVELIGPASCRVRLEETFNELKVFSPNIIMLSPFEKSLHQIYIPYEVYDFLKRSEGKRFEATNGIRILYDPDMTPSFHGNGLDTLVIDSNFSDRERDLTKNFNNLLMLNYRLSEVEVALKELQEAYVQSVKILFPTSNLEKL